MKKRAIALGFFDGVHIGHGALLMRACACADEKGLIPSALTYTEHPSKVLTGESVKLINTTQERVEIMRRMYGIEDVILKEFTAAYAHMTCSEFVRNVLVRDCDAKHVVAGYDFRFGNHGEGDAEILKKLCAESGIGCDIVERVCIGEVTVSSTLIRELIAEGDMQNAARFLGHPHMICASVEHGSRIGGEMDFPTINQSFSEDIITPKFGVYSARVYIGSKVYRAVTDIGVRPTVTKKGAVRAETHIIGFSGDLYGQAVRTELLTYIRPERRFNSIDELKLQISADILNVKQE